MQTGTTPAPPPAPRCHCIIKLGGSAITVKHKHETLRADTLAAVAADIRRLHEQLQQREDQPGIVVVHGAGSFGHFEASSYGISRPDTPQALLREGFAKTRRSVTRLNSAVVSALVDAGLPAVGLSPCGTWFAAHRRLADAGAGVTAVRALLAQGLVPVLHGDGILDLPPPRGLAGAPGQLVPSILSGDTLVRVLARALGPLAHAAFLTDVPGLLTAPPGEPGARLVAEVRVQQQQQEQEVQQEEEEDEAAAAGGGHVTWTAVLSRAAAADGSGEQAAPDAAPARVQLSTAAHDTTGGMASKVDEAAAVVLGPRGCPVVIAQAGTPSGTAAVLGGPAAFRGGSCGSSSSGGGGNAEGRIQGTVVCVAAPSGGSSTVAGA